MHHLLGQSFFFAWDVKLLHSRYGLVIILFHLREVWLECYILPMLLSCFTETLVSLCFRQTEANVTIEDHIS